MISAEKLEILTGPEPLIRNLGEGKRRFAQPKACKIRAPKLPKWSAGSQPLASGIAHRKDLIGWV